VVLHGVIPDVPGGVRFDPGAGRPRLRPDHGKCKHLYFYHNHAEYGFIGQAAQVKDTSKVREIVASVKRKTSAGKTVRTLDMLGKDRELLAAVADPTLASLGGITNKALQKKLAGTEWAKGMTGKRLSARIGRNLRLLRDHGLISKVPEQRAGYNKYGPVFRAEGRRGNPPPFLCDRGVERPSRQPWKTFL